MSERHITINISSLLWILGAVLLLVLLWQLQSLVVIFMVAIVIAATLAPAITWAITHGIPRWLAVIGVYVGLLTVITVILLELGPTVVTQVERLLRKLPTYLDTLTILAEQTAIRLGVTEPEAINLIERVLDLQGVTSWTFRSSQQLLVRSLGITRGLLGGVFSVFLALLFSGYMLSDSPRLIQGFVSLFPSPWDQRLAAQVAPVSQRMGSYIQGRLLVSTILGVAISIGLLLVGIDEFALSLGVIASVTNLIPFFGPVLGAIPALIVAVVQGGWVVLWVLLLFVVIQNIETYVLDPLLVAPSVKVPPLYQLLAVLGGVQLLGIIGALIAPPWVAGTAVLLENLYLQPKAQAQQPVLVESLSVQPGTERTQ